MDFDLVWDNKPRNGLQKGICLICLLLILQSTTLLAQYSTAGLDLDGDVSSWFDEAIGEENTPLVLGVYQKTYLTPDSHPFFHDKFWANAKIRYRGQDFEGVELRYNIHEDYVIIRHPTNMVIANQPIKLQSGQIDWFMIGEKLFVNLELNDGNKEVFQMLYKGEEVSLVSKRSKEQEIDKVSNGIGFKNDDKYYLVYKNQKFHLRGKKTFVKNLPVAKTEITNHIRKLNLIPRPRYEEHLIRLTQFCDLNLSNR